MKYWMETIALPQEQVQQTANIDILSCGGKMSAIIPLHGLLTVGRWAWEYLKQLSLLVFFFDIQF